LCVLGEKKAPFGMERNFYGLLIDAEEKMFQHFGVKLFTRVGGRSLS
jgi:hypothetical protein